MANAEELYNLTHRTKKQPKLVPISTLKPYESHVMTHLKVMKSTSRRSNHPNNNQHLLLNNMKQSSTVETVNITPNVIFKPKLPKSFYLTKLRDWAEEIPIIGLQTEWERRILQLIPKNYKKQYSQHVKLLFDEIIELYMNTMQQFAVDSIVVNDDDDDGDDFASVNVSNNELTTLQQMNKRHKLSFLQYRKMLAEKYFLSHNIITQHIVMTAHKTLLPIIIDVTDYRNHGLLEIMDIQSMISTAIRNQTYKVKRHYHKEIEMTIVNSKYLRKFNDPKVIQQFLHCAMYLFVQQILQTIMHSIDHMIATMKDDNYCPLLHVKLVCEEGVLALKPSIRDICNMYHGVIDDIGDIGKNLLPFRNPIDNYFNTEQDYISVTVPDWFIVQSHSDVEKVIFNIFQPCIDNFTCINREFQFICATKTRTDIMNLVASNKTFDVYWEQVKFFNNYSEKTREILPYVYYNFGRLDQTSAKELLTNNIDEIMGMLVMKLVNYHKEFNYTICREFEVLKEKALNVPNNTRALFELSEQMTEAAEITIIKLEDKIEKSIEMLSALLDITSLDDEHIELNKNTINWLTLIKTVFNQNNILCEAMKSELEDELQKTINIINIDVDNIVPEFIILDDMDDMTRVHEYIDYLNVLVKKIKHIDERIQAINVEEKLFKFPETTFPKLEDIKNIIMPFYELNRLIFQWRRHNAVWLDGPFEYINSHEVNELTFFYYDKFTELNKSMKTKIKSDMSTNKPFRFSGIIDDPDPMQQPAPLKLCFQAFENVKEFKIYVPLVNCMCNTALANRHWREMSKIYGADLTPNAGTTLRKIINLDLMKDIDKYEAISISANKELALEQQLEVMSLEWDKVEFTIDYDNEGKLIFTNFHDIQTHLEEHLILIQEMEGSYFVKPITTAVTKFHRSLVSIRDTIDQWNYLQHEYLIYRPVFICGITTETAALMELEKIYLLVDDTIKKLRDNIVRDPTFRNISESTEYFDQLTMMIEKIEIIDVGVCVYLESMRLNFPRFFFLANNEMMSILFERDLKIQLTTLLQKCFNGVREIKLDCELKFISIISDQSEELLLNNKINSIEMNTSEWLLMLESSIRDAVRDDIKKYIDCVEKIPILTTMYSMGITIECNAQLYWTSNVQQCFVEFHPSKIHELLNQQQAILINTIIDLKSQTINKQRLLHVQLAIILIHQRDIIKQLIVKKVTHDTDFYWIAQLRYYWQDDNVKVHMLYGSQNYGYEFHSVQCNNHIINTPLTDRCYRALIEANRHHFFGAIVGHAATGKIETIKALARALAVQFHIINCTKYVSCELVSRAIKGLIVCGVWLCFKNIDSLNFNTLSAITQKIYLTRQILSSQCELVSFEGTKLQLCSTGFITITRNPYCVTSECNNLPDNLKVLFRTVMLIRPDFRNICEIKLYAAGFDNASILADKIDKIYNLCLDQLSPGGRYNFGSRAIITVLTTTIGLKLKFPDEDENILLIRSLIDFNIPMLQGRDVIIFQGFLQDHFPQIILSPSNNYKSLFNILNEVALTDNFQVHELFKLKFVQLLEMMYMKHVFAVVGGALSGKTTILRALAKCLNLLLKEEDFQMGINVNIEIIHHKSMELKNIFGHLDVKSDKWHDGIVTKLIRNYSCDKTHKRKWIVFDGPFDSLLMENFSTILDDNKTLLLPSGESINLIDSLTSLILETDSLIDASPAVISRCGIVFIEAEMMNWRPLANAWMIKQKFPKSQNNFLNILLEWCLDECLNFAYKQCEFTLKVSKLYLVISILRLLGIYLNDAYDSTEERDKDYSRIWSQAALILSIVTITSSVLCLESHVKFDAFCTKFWCNNSRPMEIKQMEITLPNDSMIQDNVYIFKGTGFWKNWMEVMKSESAGPDLCGFGCTIVPTIDIIKHIHIFTKYIKYRVPFIVRGDTSVGKTSCMNYLLKNKLSKNHYQTNVFKFPSTIRVQQVQNSFLTKVNKLTIDHYAPPKGKFGINFIDDLSMTNDNSGQSLLELIRQYIDCGYWYNSIKSEKLFVDNLMFLGAITPSKCNNDIHSRFIRHFNLSTIQLPSRESIFRIFSTTLLYNLKLNLFTVDVMGSVNSMVNATIQVYNLIYERLRPSPINIQYQFNLRDIARVINGCSLIHKESAETKVTLIRLWVHETLRVFGDRIIDNNDNNWLYMTIEEAVKTFFKDNFDSVFDHLPKQQDQLTSESFKSLIFGNFMDPDKGGAHPRYEEVNFDALKNKIIFYLNEFNNNNDCPLDILILSDVLEHLVRVCRALSTPYGNLLMLCIGGSGRRSISRLAAFMEKQEFFELNVNSHGNDEKWREDLKTVMKICGGYGKECTFFISSRHLQDDHLEDISSLLMTGEVANLIDPVDKQGIIEIARLPAQNGDRNLEIPINDVMDYVYNQCRQKLHFIFYFNKIILNKNFQRQLKQFPTLLDYCLIDCFTLWPQEAFIQLGNHIIHDTIIDSVAIKTKIITASKHFYDDAKVLSMEYRKNCGRVTHINPSSFIHMMHLYANLIVNKQKDIIDARNRYVGGLKKLELAAEQVIKMQKTLQDLRPQLERSAGQTKETMCEIENENKRVEMATIQVKSDEKIANKTAEIAATLKSECEADLAVAIPILEDAIAALNTLKPTDITLVKAMKNPPDTVKLVMAAVCVMLGVAAERVIDPVTGKKTMDFWGPSKRVLGDMNFLQNLKDYNKDNIPSAVMLVIKKTYMPEKSFLPHIVAKASSAAEGLCKWVRAMVSYDEVAKVVAPKKEKLAAAEKECNETLAYLNEKRKTLAALNEKLTALNVSLQMTLAKKLELECEVDNCTQKLMRAEALILSLGGEKTKWSESAENLKKLYDNLRGDILLSSGVVAFLAPYHAIYRNNCYHMWREYVENLGISCTNNYNFVKSLESMITINSWYLSGLPKNDFLTENAVILMNSLQSCLFIDPQNEANSWIRKLEKRNKLIIVKLTDSTYMIDIARGMELGYPVLIENIVDLNLIITLDCILSRKICRNDCLRRSITDNSKFRLYMTTQLHNPQLDDYIFHKITVINFLLPDDALQGRLLDIVISRERPELQEKFVLLLIQSASNVRLLKEVEENILTILAGSTNNILEDEKAMHTLDSSKKLSLEIREKEDVVKVATDEIDIFRKNYNQHTYYCASLFNTLTALSNINCMYRFSVVWFTQLYAKSIANSSRSIVLFKRLDYLRSSFTKTLHSSVLNALFTKHKILYSFILCLKILTDNREVSSEEIDFFTSNNNDFMYNDIYSIKSKEIIWLPQKSWQDLVILSEKFAAFHGLDKSIHDDELSWRTFYESKYPEECSLPMPWELSLTQFQKLIILKIIRPDKTIIKISQMISTMEKYLTSVECRPNLSELYYESSCLIPLIFILPSYFEPLKLIQEFAVKLGYSSTLATISLGSNHEEQQARELILEAQKNGGWVFLQNCHLSPMWLPQLVKIYESINILNTALSFRLWLSSYSSSNFPIEILQNGVKITYDSPANLKQSLRNTYHSSPLNEPDFIQSCPGNDKFFSKALYIFGFFHAVVRERNNFGIQGWNVNYDFCHTDLKLSMLQLKVFLLKHNINTILFDALYDVIGACNYGGKMIDYYDKKCLIVILQDFCNEQTITQRNYSFTDGFTIPDRCEYGDYVKHIENLSSYSSAELFGVDENAEITRNLTIFQDFFHNLNDLDEQLDDEVVLQHKITDKILEIRENLPMQLNIDEVMTKYPINISNPLNAIIIAEVTVYNNVLEFIEKSLLNSADELLINLLNNITPHKWLIDVSTSSHRKLSKFIKNLHDQCEFFKQWITNGTPVSFPLGVFSSPKRFISTVHTIFRRQYDRDINEDTFEFDVLSIDDITLIENIKENSIYLHGLHLFGAQWNLVERKLTSSHPKIFSQIMPIICLSYSTNRQLINSYECPLYKSTEDRDSIDYNGESSNFIMPIPLATDLSCTYWCKLGVSMFCCIE